MAYYYCMSKNVKKLIPPRVLCTSITNRFPGWFDRFTAYYYCMSKNVKKTHNSASSVAQVSLIVFLVDLTVLRLITTVWAKMSQNSYLREFCELLSTNRVLSWFDRFTAYYYCMSENVKKLISPRVLCTSIKNRVPSWFDRFTSYYSCMSKSVTKFTSPFYGLLQLYEQKCHQAHIISQRVQLKSITNFAVS